MSGPAKRLDQIEQQLNPSHTHGETVPGSLALNGKRMDCSDEEWKARVELAACYRLMAHFKMEDLIYNHISARIPGTEHFLLNPFGLLYDEITASSLVKVDLEGNIVTPTPFKINQAGFVIHSAVHQIRPEINCVIHSHTPAGTGVSAQEGGLLPISQTALLFYGEVAYHEFEGPAFNLGEREMLAKDMGKKKLMILRNHGLLTAGETVQEAFVLMYYLEEACRIQVNAQAGGAKLHFPPEQAMKETVEYFNKGGIGMRGQVEWTALIRKLDRLDPSYRT